MSGFYRAPTWGPRRARAFDSEIKAFSSKVGALASRVDKIAAAEGTSGSTCSEEAREVLQLEHEALLMADEELRVQLDELHRSEEQLGAQLVRYKSLFINSLHAYVVTDGHGYIQEANEEFAHLLAVDVGSLTQESLATYVSPVDTARFIGQLGSLASLMHASFCVSFMVRDGAPISVSVAVRVLPEGGLLWCVEPVEDRPATHSLVPPAPGAPIEPAQYWELDERYRRERRAREQLEAANAAKDRLLAVVSHDLRTPLNSMLGWTQLIKRTAGNGPVRERALEAIERSGRAQTELINQLLDFTRIAAGKLRVSLESVDLAKVVATVTEAIEPVAAARGVHLRLLLPREPVVIKADRLRLEQIASNLLGNAVKFTGRRGEVVVRVAVDLDGLALFEVRDNGMGIPPQLLPKIFDRFSQGTQSQASEGLGLGLFIVRELVQLHFGTIEAHSAGLNLGSTFVVRFPSVRAEAPPDSQITVAATRARVLTGLDVLLVEDDVENSEMVATALRAQRANVHVALGLGEALESFGSTRPSVLVIDVGSGPSKACAFLHAIRDRIGGDLPAIALSAHAGVEDVDVFMKAGFDAHLAKPISFDDLVDSVGAAARLTRSSKPERR